jgi:N-acetyl-gamma-glutamyl-phosphate reductase
VGARVAVAGASGYAGGELLRLLAGHPDLELVAATASDNAGRLVTDVHPHLRSFADLHFASTAPETLADADLVFLALPHGAAAPLAAALPLQVKVVDLGSDHRLVDEEAHRRYYGGPFPGAWTYGLPELPGQRPAIRNSARVANTGCHAVAAVLGLAPLVAAGLINPTDVVLTSISGTSGAGRALQPHLLGSEVMGNVSAYKVGAHRHVPEIKQAARITGLAMTPVLAPMARGILSCAGAWPARRVDEGAVRAVLADAYRDEPFVHVLAPGQQPQTAATVGSNSAHLQGTLDGDTGRVLVTCALDNLGKGAAGQALQNANLMLGLSETAGLATDGAAP